MIYASFTEFRRRLAHYMDRAHMDRAAVLVSRQGAEPVVVIAQSEYDGLLATLHLRSTPTNATRLDASLAALELGEGHEVLWDEESSAFRPL
jgi:antitoxin YefM